MCKLAFWKLKKQITKISILAHFNSELKTIVKLNSNNYVFAKILSQKKENNIVRFIAYFSKTLLSAECNYKIYDKELLTIIRYFEK